MSLGPSLLVSCESDVLVPRHGSTDALGQHRLGLVNHLPCDRTGDKSARMFICRTSILAGIKKRSIIMIRNSVKRTQAMHGTTTCVSRLNCCEKYLNGNI